MRRCCTATRRGAFALLESKASQQLTNLTEMLDPPAGETGGASCNEEMSLCIDFQDPRKRPWYNYKVSPMARKVTNANRYYFKGMRDWGYHSLTMFKHVNEDTGFWCGANSSNFISLWNMIGEFGVGSFWCGIHRRTYGIGCFNLRPSELRQQAWGYKDRVNGAIRVKYDPLQPTLQKYCLSHTAEHAQHQRLKNPDLIGYAPMQRLCAKRALREIQWHLGEGMRYYLIDGVFGSDGLHDTPYRIVTDNPTHAYFISLAAIRNRNMLAEQEVPLIRRVGRSPFEEWGWRRPGVLVYHTPTYEFEAPRIVEEFAGPRPADLGLRHNRYILLEPYSIPMKGVISAEPRCDVILDVTAFLCARWGFYADEANLLTLPSDSVLSRDGARLTLVISDTHHETERVEANSTNHVSLLELSVRSSPYLYGYRHHRISTDGIISRAWDVKSCPVGSEAPQTNLALIEDDYHRCHEPLPTRIGLPHSVSHRFHNRRNLVTSGYMLPHRYTDDNAERAYAAGLLFHSSKSDNNNNNSSSSSNNNNTEGSKTTSKNVNNAKLQDHLVRPRGFHLSCVDVLILLEANTNNALESNEIDAAEAIMRVLRNKAFVYAEEDVLKAALREQFLAKVHSVRIMYTPSNTTQRTDSSDEYTKSEYGKSDVETKSESNKDNQQNWKQVRELLQTLSLGNIMEFSVAEE